jgi:nucleoside-diphosphate-sugar epimerase
MKTLVVGGTGFIGGATALHLRDTGHEVTLMSRSRPGGTSQLNDLPFVAGNYIEDDFSKGQLDGYDWLVFCAGSDFSNYPLDGSVSEADFFEKANIVALPRFFEHAKAAGISRAVYAGSLYSFVAPETIETIPYVRSRHLSDAAIRSLSGPSFNVCSLALPFITGFVPGFSVDHLVALARYADGKLDGVPDFAPPGGNNFMDCHAVAQAMLGGLERGEAGKSYLVGDVNLSWKDFFELWFRAAGRPRDLEVRRGHPIMPDFALSYISYGMPDYEPPAEETALLGYDRGGVVPQVDACYRYYSGIARAA